MMLNYKTMRADCFQDATVWVCDCCNTELGWQWVIDTLAVDERSDVDSWELACKRTAFNIKFQLILTAYSTNLPYLSSIVEMLGRQEHEENTMGKKLGKGEWNSWERRLKIEIGEYDEVVKEIETGVKANFDTEDMEEEVVVEAVLDEELNTITPRRLEMMPKRKYAGPTGLAKWTSLFRRNEDRRSRHVLNKQRVIKCMLKNINDEIYSAIEIMEGFEDAKRDLNVKGIYEAMKIASSIPRCFQIDEFEGGEQQMANLFQPVLYAKKTTLVER